MTKTIDVEATTYFPISSSVHRSVKRGLTAVLHVVRDTLDDVDDALDLAMAKEFEV